MSGTLGAGTTGSLGYGSSGIGGSIFAVGNGIGAGIDGGLNLANNENARDTEKDEGEKQLQAAAGSEEDEDGDYEPNLEEIHGYAKFLGMNLETDQEFLFIAEEGLKAPVPEPWKTFFNENDEIFYVNPVTNEKMYDHPLDEEYRQKFLRLKAQRDVKQNERAMQGNNLGNQNRMMGGLNQLNNKTADPLIRAEAEKKLKEQRYLYH